ncbi:ATP-binding protein [Sphingobium sp.]|uniref:AlbA family DNA-binding domain-containing protein n=1 Tax=Sphingobium sp. TaxID=1912891 RepID=UPI0028BEACDD|nr:ATP-binding protein [Sphingobium sp.]
MQSEDIEALLNGAEETDTLEFKAAVAWDRNLFVKDILAMANVIDGGRIVVGVEDQTFQRQGLTPGQLASYRIDEMRDGIAPFADPRAIFRMDAVADLQGRWYVVIEVSSFEDVPVICRRDGADVRAGTIYFRGRTRRPESAPVSNSADMRDMVERAAALSARRLRRIGFVPDLPAGPDYDAELGGL